MAVVQNRSLTLKAKFFRGLADPSRLALLEALRGGEKTVSELVAATGLSQPNASAHLACLKECGLVTSRPQGRFVYYALADPRIEDLLRIAEGILADVAAQVYACTRYEG
ncbi:ArsR/SmtB family transcription factor [Thermoflexus sp.]|uniref:ArsR/SmtB family transcription factor n=1 Tax=Thermoflexus sp. TaxID=1969742 RepID=UPI0035E43019